MLTLRYVIEIGSPNPNPIYRDLTLMWSGNSKSVVFFSSILEGCPSSSPGRRARQAGGKHPRTVGHEQDRTRLDIWQGKANCCFLVELSDVGILVHTATVNQVEVMRFMQRNPHCKHSMLKQSL